MTKSEQLSSKGRACCAECGKKESNGFALYCVECVDKINAQLGPDYATIAGLKTSVGHLSALVDELRKLLGTAMGAMKKVELSGSPIDESNGDADCRVPCEQWAAFIDTRAKLLFAVKRSAHDGMLTIPQQLQPLTDEQILANETLRYHFGLNGGTGPVSEKGKAIVGAVEATHGITTGVA